MVRKRLRLVVGVISAVALALAHTATAGPNPQKVRILASTFPMYLFTRNVGAGVEGIDINIMLSSNLGCPHDYVLTPEDMERIRRSEIFIANGLGLEDFLNESILRANPDMILVDTSSGIGDLLEIQPRRHHEKHDHGHDAAPKQHAHSHEPVDSKHKASLNQEPQDEDAESNPHLFASPRMAIKIVSNIAAALASSDPVNAEKYRRNAESYNARLGKLSEDFIAVGKEVRTKRIVTQHAVFDYLARDAGLEIVAVVQERPGQEPSASEMIDLVGTIKRKKAAALFTEPQYPAKVGDVIAREAGIPLAVLDPVASGPQNAPLDYYETVMRGNLETLKKVLGNVAK